MHTCFALYKQLFFLNLGPLILRGGGEYIMGGEGGGSQLLLNTNFSGSLTQDT